MYFNLMGSSSIWPIIVILLVINITTIMLLKSSDRMFDNNLKFKRKRLIKILCVIGNFLVVLYIFLGFLIFNSFF